MLFLSSLLLLAFSLLLIFFCWWRACCCQLPCRSSRPCVIVAGNFYVQYCTVQWLNETHQTIGSRLLDCHFFCYQTIWISNIWMANSRNYRISDQGLSLSDYPISDSQKTIGCPPLFITSCWQPFLKQNHSLERRIYLVFFAVLNEVNNRFLSSTTKNLFCESGLCTIQALLQNHIWKGGGRLAPCLFKYTPQWSAYKQLSMHATSSSAWITLGLQGFRVYLQICNTLQTLQLFYFTYIYH